MSKELDEIKADHERAMSRHVTYKKRKMVSTSLFYLSLVALVFVLLFYSGDSSQESSCAICDASPWIAFVLTILCVVLFGLVAKQHARGVNAYVRAMRTLGSLRNTNK